MNDNILKKNKKLKFVSYLILGLYAVVVIYPLLFMVFTSFKTNDEFFVNLFSIPKVFHFENYSNAWSIGKLGIYFLNSAFVTSFSVIVTAILSLFGGYALAKLYIPKANLIMDLFMAFSFIPGIAIYISLYSLMSKLHLTGGYISLILPYIAWQIPFSMYIMKQYFETIPSELIESARIDGCTEFQIFSKVMLPIVKPAIATIVVFTFIGNWGELMWANIATASSVSIKTLPVGLLNFKTEMGVQWGQYTAGITLVSAPLMIIFAFCQKYFVSGLTNGAVKG